MNMNQIEPVEFRLKTDQDRTVMYLLYGLHTLAWFSGGVFAVIALIINYLRRADESDAIFLDHHNYMIRTFWWTWLWLAVLSPLWLLIIPGAIAYGIVWLWYLYRCIRGWMRIASLRPASY